LDRSNTDAQEQEISTREHISAQRENDTLFALISINLAALFTPIVHLSIRASDTSVTYNELDQ
jgi:hypothetical protein